MLADIIKKNEELSAEQIKTKSVAASSAKEAGAPAEDDNMMMIIIIAAAAVVVLLVCVAGVMLMGGGKNNNKGDDQRNVVAFENPMYDAPNQQQYGGYVFLTAPPPLLCNGGKSTLWAWSPLCRDGVVSL